MALVKDEWIIRKSSSISIEKAENYIRNQLDKKQDDDKNKNLSGDYVDFYFADLFDSRDGSLYRIYSTAATENSKVIDGSTENGDSYYNVVKISEIYDTISEKYVTKSYANDNLVKIVDLNDYLKKAEIEKMIKDAINSSQIDEVVIG
jgi:hypothetical protein